MKEMYKSVEARVPVWIKCARVDALGMMLNQERTPAKSCSVSERVCVRACVCGWGGGALLDKGAYLYYMRYLGPDLCVNL